MIVNNLTARQDTTGLRPNPQKMTLLKTVGRLAMLAGAIGVFAMLGVMAASAAAGSLEHSFDGEIDPAEMRQWLKRMSSEPNHVGSPHDKENAEWELAQFKAFGWDAHLETFEVLYPTPITENVELQGAQPYKLTLQEPPIPGDSSATAKDPALPAYLAYQGDGDVTAASGLRQLRHAG